MITAVEPRSLKYWVGGEWRTSQTSHYMDCFDPSIGEVVARTPQCTPSEVESAIAAAKAAFPAWADMPPNKRVQVLFRMKLLLDKHQEELTRLVAEEHGKVWDEAMGDVLKVTEVVEFAAGAPQLLKGPAIMNATPGYDTTQYLEPVGVFAGIAPWNFPAMIPMGWMAPLCIATGQYDGDQGRQLRAADLHAHHGALGGGRASARRPQPRDLLPQGGGDPPDPPRREGDFLRRVHLGGQAHLRHGGRARQARAGPYRGEEPRARSSGRRPGADRTRHRELGLRVRGREVHGAARRRGGGEDRRRPRGGAGEGDGRAEDRARVRQGQPARTPGQR